MNPAPRALVVLALLAASYELMRAIAWFGIIVWSRFGLPAWRRFFAEGSDIA